MKDFKHQMLLWTWKGVSVFALLVSSAALFVALIALPQAGVDTTPLSSDSSTTTNIVPAVGADGYPVLEFCEHEETIVSRILVPDGSGETYQLVRIFDGVPEAIVWPSLLSGPYATEAEASAQAIAGQVAQQAQDGRWYAGPPTGASVNATFYYTEDDRLEGQVQRSAQAVVNDDAARCILEKAR